MLSDVKKALRITIDSFDTELTSLIAACKEELNANNVDVDNEKFAELIRLTVINFTKIHFGNNENSAKYELIYNNLKGYLMSSNPKQEVEN